MALTEVFQVQFVESVPDQLEEGTLYVSMRFATVSHLCACGCGTETVTPLDPTDYQLLYDGNTITLRPSIGNWQYPCRSHYFIRRNRVVWSDDMTEEQIAAGRQKSRETKERVYGKTFGADASSTPAAVTQRRAHPGSTWKKLTDRVRKWTK